MGIGPTSGTVTGTVTLPNTAGAATTGFTNVIYSNPGLMGQPIQGGLGQQGMGIAGGLAGQQAIPGQFVQQQYQPPPPMLRVAALDSDIMQADIIACAALWETRFGEKWVKLEEVSQDETYAPIAQRLIGMKWMEAYSHPYAYRLVPKELRR